MVLLCVCALFATFIVLQFPESELMAHRSDPVSTAVYRSVLRYARRFDKNIAAKALINQHGIVRPPSGELLMEADRGDRRLYAAGLDVVVGTQFLMSPERMTWSLQRLIKNLRRADKSNLEVITERTATAKTEDGSLPLSEEPRVGQIQQADRAAVQSVESFFPGALRGVNAADKVNAGFAALRQLSSTWALAGSLGLTGKKNSNINRAKRKRKKIVPTKMTMRAQRALRHHERRSSGSREQPRQPAPGVAGIKLSKGVVEPTNVPAKGVFLISHPVAGLHAPGDIFHRSVVLLVHHYHGGSYGLVVNKERGETLEEAISPDSAPLASEALRRVLHNPVRSGGPVMSRLAWLHHHEEVGGVPLSEDSHDPVFFCGTMEKASELLGEGAAEPTDFSLLVGASMWASGQLQGELDRGMWIMAKAPASLALEGGENLWRQMLDAMGGPYAELARVPHGNSWAQIGARNLPSDWP